MVTKKVIKRAYYKCGICGNWCNTHDEAQKCESKGRCKVELGLNNFATHKWRKGDIAVINNGSESCLGMVVGEKVNNEYKHSIVPVWLFLDDRAMIRSSWVFEDVLFVNAQTKHRIKRWAEILDNLSEIKKKELK